MPKKLPSIVDYLLQDILSDIPFLREKRMFGGWGLYAEKKMFGLCDGEEIFLKVPAEISVEMEEKGSRPFSYEKNGKKISMKHYFCIPQEIFDDSTLLRKWAEEAIEFSKE